MFGQYDALEGAEPVPEAEAIRSTSHFLASLVRAFTNSRKSDVKKPCTPCEKRKATLLQQAQVLAGRG